VSEYIARARQSTLEKFEALKRELEQAGEKLGNRGCVFATGSFGRLEAGAESDVDVFIVVKTYQRERNGKQETLFRLKDTEQICLKHDIIVAAEKVGITEFDAGGKYLQTHSFEYFTEYLGSPEDDYLNTFTGRMLLLLESRVLIGENSYKKLVEDVISAYFTDFSANKNNFIPAFLFNDILRMWRTFCVNYEFFRKQGGGDWRIKNLKLKYIRIVTCFSAIVYLLAVFTVRRTITPEIVEAMVAVTPTERLLLVAHNAEFKSLQHSKELSDTLSQILNDYSSFMELNHLQKEEALQNFEANEDKWRAQSFAFGAKFAKAMSLIAGEDGFENPLYRVTLV
jgi:predicted nucleotidyltransferase